MSRQPKEPFVLQASDEPHLKQIPERLTQPLCLAHKGTGYKGIAHQLNIPIGTVRSRINRARERILTMRAKVVAAAASDQLLESADD